MGRPRTLDDVAIFAATGRAMMRHGYAHLTLAAVADELSISAPGLIKRFGSKKGLLLAFAEWTLWSSRERFRLVRRKHASPLEALLARFLLRADEIEDPAGMANVMAFWADIVPDPAFRDVSEKRVRLFEEEIGHLLQEAYAAGELAACDIPRLSRALHASMTGAIVVWALDPSRPAEEWMRDVFEGVVGAYRRAPARSQSEGGSLP